VAQNREVHRFGSRCSGLPLDGYNVTVVNVGTCEVTVKIIMFADGEPLIVTWIIKVSKRTVTNSPPAPGGGGLAAEK
jgi:hypothetical protein